MNFELATLSATHWFKMADTKKEQETKTDNKNEKKTEEEDTEQDLVILGDLVLIFLYN